MYLSLYNNTVDPIRLNNSIYKTSITSREKPLLKTYIIKRKVFQKFKTPIDLRPPWVHNLDLNEGKKS